MLYSARLQPNAQTLYLARKTYQGHAIAYFVPSSVTKIQFFIIFVQCHCMMKISVKFDVL